MRGSDLRLIFLTLLSQPPQRRHRYLFHEQPNGDPPIVVAFATIGAIVRSVVVRGKDLDPGVRLDLHEHLRRARSPHPPAKRDESRLILPLVATGTVTALADPRRSRRHCAQSGSRTRTPKRRLLRPGCLPFHHLRMVVRKGFEPSRSFEHGHLEPACLPASPPDGTGRGSCALIARFKVSLPTLGARSLHARIRTEKNLLLRQVRLPITPRAVGGTRRSRTADLSVSAGSNRVPRHRGVMFQEEGRRIERLRFRAPRSSNPVTRHWEVPSKSGDAIPGRVASWFIQPPPCSGRASPRGTAATPSGRRRSEGAAESSGAPSVGTA